MDVICDIKNSFACQGCHSEIRNPKNCKKLENHLDKLREREKS